MKNREQLEYFCEESLSKHDDDYIERFFLRIDKENYYVGRNRYIQGIKITYYIFPKDNYQAFLFLYIGDNIFDEFCDSIDEYSIEAYTKTWPLLIKSLEDGCKDNYSTAALIKLPNINKDGSFWCFATLLENIQYNNLETDYVTAKLVKLLDNSISILNQYAENDITNIEKVKAYGKVAYDEYKKYETIKSVMKGIGLAASIVGSFVGGLDLSSVASIDS